MESYVTSYSGAENATKTAMTQAKLNSCLKSLHDLVDTFEPLETTQTYGELSIENQDYYEGFTKQVDVPETEVPVLARICNLTLRIGTIDLQGNFVCTKPGVSSSYLNLFRLLDVQTTDWEGEWQNNEPPPRPQNTENLISTTPVDNLDIDNNGAKLHDTGVHELWINTSYYNLRLDDQWIPSETSGYYRYRWIGTKQTVRYFTEDINREIDLSNFKINILRRYKRNVSRIATD